MELVDEEKESMPSRDDDSVGEALPGEIVCDHL